MAEVRLAAPVKATHVGDIDAVEAIPGAFEYYVHQSSGDTPRGMIYSCPCGCKQQGALAFNPRLPDDTHSWNWDGNLEMPTLTPSVHHVGHWHGYLRAGYWEQA